MDNMKIENLNGSPYSGARYLYNDLNEDNRHETMDLLQMVPNTDRPNNTPPIPDPPQVNRPYHTGTGCPNRSIQSYYSPPLVQNPDQVTHLCHKHAREMENQSNTLYSQRPGYNKEEDPYYSRVPNTSLYKEAKPLDKQDAGSVYFNYLKQFKRKQSQTRCSTQSLPAVTYTINKQTSNNKHFFKKPSNLFKNHQTATKSYSTGSINKHSDLFDKDTDYTGIKRLLIVVCILVGVILALGGIVIGFVILPAQEQREGSSSQCAEDSIFCTDLGCVPLSTVCTDPDFVCPGYTALAICSPSSQENQTRLDLNQEQDSIPRREPSVMSNLIYDESEWVHYINSSGGESMYTVVSKTMSFSAAQDECQKYHGHLAHVTDIREQVFLEDYLMELYTTSELLRNSKGVWLGARRDRGSNSEHCLHHNQWLWKDSYGRQYGTINGFSAFASGKPDDFYNPEECLYLMTEVDQQDSESWLKWDDAPCDMHGLVIRPLCEVEIKTYPYHGRR